MLVKDSITHFTNPFSTRHVQPGAIPYRRNDGGELVELVNTFFQRCNRRAAIVGPHGSGKSTLIETIKPLLVNQNCQVDHRRFSTSQRKWKFFFHDSRDWDHQTIVVVDGYEQLSWMAKIRLHTRIWKTRTGLLVTTHFHCRLLPTLWETTVDDQQSDWVLSHLLAEHPHMMDELQSTAIWHELKKSHPDNMRERLMDLYDWVEDRRTR